jgi:hypothetical protein
MKLHYMPLHAITLAGVYMDVTCNCMQLHACSDHVITCTCMSYWPFDSIFGSQKFDNLKSEQKMRQLTDYRSSVVAESATGNRASMAVPVSSHADKCYHWNDHRPDVSVPGSGRKCLAAADSRSPSHASASGRSRCPRYPRCRITLCDTPAESPYATLQRSGTSKRLMEQGSYHDSYRAGAW